MKEMIIDILGQYTPVTYPDGSPMGGLASLDYEWLVGALLFAGISLIVLKCISSVIISLLQGR